MNSIVNVHADLVKAENLAGGQGDNIRGLTVTSEQYHMAINYVYNVLQKEGLATNLDQLKAKIDNDTSKLKWEVANRDFRLQRTEVERKYEYLKLLSLQADDGILNYAKRLAPSRKGSKMIFERLF